MNKELKDFTDLEGEIRDSCATDRRLNGQSNIA